jgi:phage FluMu protein Com
MMGMINCGNCHKKIMDDVSISGTFMGKTKCPRCKSITVIEIDSHSYQTAGIGISPEVLTSKPAVSYTDRGISNFNMIRK